jgi:hypothetical protein
VEGTADDSNDSTEYDRLYTSGWEVYIGDSDTWSNNEKCSGGPFLAGTYDDYFDSWATIDVPGFGFEVWCNMEGRYTFFVASGVPSESVSICSIAVTGTIYVRDTAIDNPMTVTEQETTTFTVKHIYS